MIFPTDLQEIAKLERKHGLTYHVRYAAKAEELVGLRGKSVLEVGGNLPADFVLNDLGAKRWIAIEAPHYAQTMSGCNVRPENPLIRSNVLQLTEVTDLERLGPNKLLYGEVENPPPSFYGQFDIVFSIAAFEHILRLPTALDRMFRALRPGGKLFAMFSPI